MTRTPAALALFLLPLAATLSADSRDDRDQGRRDHGGQPRQERSQAYAHDKARHDRGSGPYSRSKRHPSAPKESERLREDRSRSHIDLPKRGPDQRRFKARPYERREASSRELRSHFRTVMHDRRFLAGLGRLHRTERVAGRYYWHKWNHVDYCHYYDRWGYHWYGWTLGPRFFWVRSFGGRFWWFDAELSRWCFWWGGHWWWPDPLRANVVFVYRDGQYLSEAPEEPDSVAATASPTPPPYVDPKDMPPLPEELPADPEEDGDSLPE